MTRHGEESYNVYVDFLSWDESRQLHPVLRKVALLLKLIGSIALILWSADALSTKESFYLEGGNRNNNRTMPDDKM